MGSISQRKGQLAPHWFWFFIILSVITLFDYIEHIVRDNSQFIERPFQWLLFTIFSHVTLLVIAFGLSKLLNSAKIPELVASTLGVAAAVFTHLTVSGPLWDELFWFGNLRFNDFILPTVVASVFYLIYRGIFYLIPMLFKKFSS